MPKTTFAVRLATLRQAAGLTQYRLAQLSGVGRQFIAELERGQKLPGWSVVLKLADALGVGVEEFRENE